MTESVADKIRRLGSPGERSEWWRGYNEAIDMAARIAEGRHSIIECSNARCSSPIRGLHCFECDELDDDYDANHIRLHADPNLITDPSLLV